MYSWRICPGSLTSRRQSSGIVDLTKRCTFEIRLIQCHISERHPSDWRVWWGDVELCFPFVNLDLDEASLHIYQLPLVWHEFSRMTFNLVTRCFAKKKKLWFPFTMTSYWKVIEPNVWRSCLKMKALQVKGSWLLSCCCWRWPFFRQKVTSSPSSIVIVLLRISGIRCGLLQDLIVGTDFDAYCGYSSTRR